MDEDSPLCQAKALISTSGAHCHIECLIWLSKEVITFYLYEKGYSIKGTVLRVKTYLEIFVCKEFFPSCLLVKNSLL